MQQYNAELVKLLSAHFPLRRDASYSWGRTVSGFQLIPNLRAYWSCSSVDEDGNLFDMSGQGRRLDIYSGTYAEYGLVPYIDFQVATTDYLYRPTEPGLEIAKDLTIWTWIYFDPPSTGAQTFFLGKWLGAADMSYLLYKTAGDALAFVISQNGAVAAVSVTDAAANYVTGKWLFVAGRFLHSSLISLFVGKASDGTYAWYNQATAVPSIYKGAAAFEVGRSNGGNYLDGGMSQFGLSAMSLSNLHVWNLFSQTRPLFI